MTQLANKLAPDSKCYVTFGSLSSDPSTETPPKRPYNTIIDHVYNQQVDILLPNEICELVHQKLNDQLKPLQYHRIFMGLKEILEKEFYNHYIREGNIILLSDGRIDVDDVYCLYDGVLYLFLRKETYEKAGLVGKKAVFGGRKKERWVVENDLRQPHMLHGRKAFDRLVWSFTNVFKEQKPWLFCDLNQQALNQSTAETFTTLIGLTLPSTPRTAALTVTQPSDPIKLATFSHTIPANPSTSDYDKDVFYDWAYCLHEWLALTSLNSDRLNASDSIDPLLSRYEPPLDNANQQQFGKIAKISWRGFIPAGYILKIFKVLEVSVPPSEWFVITAHGFQNAPVSWKGRQHSAIGGGMGGENLYTILKFAREGEKETGDVAMEGTEEGDAKEADAREKYVMWEVVGGRDEHS
ncbi:hypothetical protein TWF694_001082 [Orbilia ellipsospora]|uniref:Uncharacterized protein n=1 Tax=Orbilia ellipsospora TaxID=2528407 RepID=A0AAV9XQL7_9PEZI